MIPKAVFAMLATVASARSLGRLRRIRRGKSRHAHRGPREARGLVTADAGMRGGKAIPYTPGRRALRLAKHPPRRSHRRPQGSMPGCPRRRARSRLRRVTASTRARRCRAPGSNRRNFVHPLHLGTRDAKGVQRDKPAATRRADRLDHDIFWCRAAPGETMFTTTTSAGSSDIRISSMHPAERLDDDHVRGLPIRPDPGICGRSSPSTRCADVHVRRPRSAS